MKLTIAPVMQRELLRYLTQNPEGVEIVPQLQGNGFEVEEYQVIFKLLKKFVNEYGKQPTQTGLEIKLTEFAKDKLDKEDLDDLLETVAEVYEPLQILTEHAKEEALKIAAIQQGTKYIEKYQSQPTEWELKDLIQLRDNLTNCIELKVTLGETTPTLRVKQDWFTKDDDLGKVYPFFIEGVNKLKAAGGFHPPETIIILGKSKSFKTGLFIKAAVEYAKQGYDIFVADMENGKRSYKARFKQCIMGLESHELFDPNATEHDDETKEHDDPLIAAEVEALKQLKGRIIVKNYSSYEVTAQQIKNDILREQRKSGFKPVCVIWDYPDIMKPVRWEKDLRLRIQNIYHDILKVNRELEVFSLVASHISSSAKDKELYDMFDFAEDTGKSRHAHACYGWNRNDGDLATGMCRFNVVFQRQGEPEGLVFLGIDEAIQDVYEITQQEYLLAHPQNV